MEMKQPPMNREARGEEAAALTPAVDVYEDENGITVKADLPGVSKEDLSIRVDGDTLVVEGRVNLGETQQLRSVYAEVRHSQFRRTFVLSRDLDATKIDAALRSGALTLTIPKIEKARPRRIAVRAE
jgi:HSP20 family molecular chaperone IbpA